jgi:hypothetical protein
MAAVSGGSGGREVHMAAEFLPAATETAAEHVATAAARAVSFEVALPEGVDPLSVAIAGKMSTWGPERVAVFGDLGASGAHLGAAAAAGAALIEAADAENAASLGDIGV